MARASTLTETQPGLASCASEKREDEHVCERKEESAIPSEPTPAKPSDS